MKQLVGLLQLLLVSCTLFAQSQPGTTDQVLNFPSHFFSKLNQKTTRLTRQLDQQTGKYLAQLTRQDNRLLKRMVKMDSTATRSIPLSQYTTLEAKLHADSARTVALSGEYLPGIDSLKGTLTYLSLHPQLLGSNPEVLSHFQQSFQQYQLLQAKLQDADQIRQYARDRQSQLRQYVLNKFTKMPTAIAAQYQGLQQNIYYYSARVHQYREMLNSPDQLMGKALVLLNHLPSFQQYMKGNGQLGSLFNVPGNYAAGQSLSGLQTKEQIQALVQNKASLQGSTGTAAIRQSLQMAQGQLDQYKNKISQLGGGGADIDMPDFKQNNQKTKTFLKRLEAGFNIQTTQSTNYYPTLLLLGVSLGYRLTDGFTFGVGAAYNIGLGNGFQHMSFSSNGASLRSFFDCKLKGTFFMSGGLEYNYVQPFTDFQQIRNLSQWQASGLMGISKIISVKSKVFKKTKVSLLWDALSYSNRPPTAPFKFRVGYAF